MHLDVLTWLSMGSLVLALGLAGRWVLRRHDTLGRPVPFPVVSVVVLVVVAAGLLVPVVRHHRLEQRLSSAVSELTGIAMTVRCQTAGEEFVDAGAELGYVRYSAAGVPERTTLVKRQQCAALADYLGSDKTAPGRDQVVAVHVLTHEAMHMAGETNEVVAECQAVQRDARTAQLLGADPVQAGRLAAAYWREVYPSMPDTYRSPDCAPGGVLDERIAAAAWSTPAAS